MSLVGGRYGDVGTQMAKQVTGRNVGEPAEMLRAPSLREQLLQQRERNAAEVARLDKALALLEEVPKVEELLDLLRGY